MNKDVCDCWGGCYYSDTPEKIIDDEFGTVELRQQSWDGAKELAQLVWPSWLSLLRNKTFEFENTCNEFAAELASTTNVALIAAAATDESEARRRQLHHRECGDQPRNGPAVRALLDAGQESKDCDYEGYHQA